LVRSGGGFFGLCAAGAGCSARTAARGGHGADGGSPDADDATGSSADRGVHGTASLPARFALACG
jgi:hypothetical protein